MPRIPSGPRLPLPRHWQRAIRSALVQVISLAHYALACARGRAGQWNHLKNHELKAHRAQTKQELYDLTQEKLEDMSEDPDLLHGLYFRCCVAELLR